MKVVHLSANDVSGGAARAAWRVHDGLRHAGAKSSMLSPFRESQDPDVQQYLPNGGTVDRLGRTIRGSFLKRELAAACRNRPSGFEDHRDDRTIYGLQVGENAPDADVYHLHQISDFVDCASLKRLAARAPIVWTLHEQSPFTGGCHYTYDCSGFIGECGACPQLGSSNPRDFSHAIWKRRHRAYGRIAPSRMHVVGPSRWIAAEASRSSLFGRFPVSVIPYGLNTDVFRPMPDARRLLDAFGIPPSTRVVLFVVDWTGNRRKGFDLLDSALGVMRHAPDTALLSLGRGDPPRLQSSLPHVHLGGFTEDRMIAAVYSMADLFVIPSRQDDLPNTVLEAMACGTAVVGFRVGGIPDMVRDGENGLLVPPGDAAGLARAIETLLADEPRRTSMGRAGRAIAEREYPRTLQAQRYLSLYRTLIGSTEPGGPRSCDHQDTGSA